MKFSYIARTAQGKKKTGIVDVSSEDDLVSRLQEQGLTVTRVVPLEEKKGHFSPKKPQKTFSHRKVKLYDLVFFARQLSTLLDSGITLHRALDALLKQVSSSLLYKIIVSIKKDVEAGASLRDALAKHPRVFSDLWINLVESGEASGNLAMTLDRLAKYLEREAGFKRKIVSALIYPAILFTVSCGAIFFFVVKIIPTFSGLFSGLGAKLPAATRILVGFSQGVRRGFWPALIVLAVAFFLFRRFRQTNSGRRAIDVFKLRLPLFGNFFKVLCVERFTSQMATLVEGGVPILYALEITERGVGNKILEGVVHSVKNSVREGRPLAAMLGESGFFEPMVVQMISVGEEVGELAKMFRRVASFYEEYVDTFVGRFATIFEPIMIVFMGGVIGVMLVALFLPIFSIVNIGGGM
ncbi:MAG: type II secretion system F family protein [Candidatus Omnitrophota bacterium]